MAKEIEIAFSSIRNRKSIKSLKSTDYGAFALLVQACLLDGFDPLPEDRATLQVLARLTPQQWNYAEEKVSAALSDTLGLLRKDYEYRVILLEKRIEIAKRGGAANREYWKRKKEVNVSGKQMVDSESLLGIIQPIQVTRFRPQNYSSEARNHALKTKHNNPTSTVLSD